MAAGVGKTYAMLEAARKTTIGWRGCGHRLCRTHGRKDTDAFDGGLPMIPRKTSDHRGMTLSEMDVDAVVVAQAQAGFGG